MKKRSHIMIFQTLLSHARATIRKKNPESCKERYLAVGISILLKRMLGRTQNPGRCRMETHTPGWRRRHQADRPGTLLATVNGERNGGIIRDLQCVCRKNIKHERSVCLFTRDKTSCITPTSEGPLIF